jgi:microsomal epoxide hydrolase
MPLFGPLTDPVRHGRPQSDAFHVVCPALPGLGWSRSNTETCLTSIAAACRELMARLAYGRYLAHGSDVGAGVARALAASDGARLAGAHVTACPAFPPPDPMALAALSREEKSQLALLTALEEAESCQPTASAFEQLALALSQLLDALGSLTSSAMADRLLAGLTLSALGGDAELQGRLRRQARRESDGSSTPLSVCSFPLDAPCLRRFAEHRHHVVEWVEHERGGSLPGLEQPELLLSSLLGHGARFR